jgi:hypothetical protein
VSVVFIPVLLAADNTAVKAMDSIPASGANLVITNGSATNAIYVGSSSSVTTVNGAVIPPYGTVTLRNVTSSDPIYVVAGTVDAAPGTAVGVFYGDTQTG